MSFSLHVRLQVEMAARLGVPELFYGLTTDAGRINRLRREIVGRGLGDRPVVSSSSDTWEIAFQRAFGVGL